MKMDFTVVDPDKLEFSMTVVMTLSQWKELRGALSTARYPDFKFIAAINDMVKQADKHFTPDEKETP